MLVDQMYPETRLRAKHLPLNMITVVTIEGLDFETIKKKGEQPEIVYLLKLREFRLPMKLKMTDAKGLGDAINQDTDYWIGAVIGIQPRMLKIGNDPEEKWTIDVYGKLNPGMVPSLPPNSEPVVKWTQKSGMPPTAVQGALPVGSPQAGLPGAAPGAVWTEPAPSFIGETGSQIVDTLAKRNRSLADFWHWLTKPETQAPRAVLDSASGIPLVRWPLELVPWLKRFCQLHPVCKDGLLPSEAGAIASSWIVPPAMQGEAVDTVTGEVIDRTQHDAPGPTGAETQVHGFQPAQTPPPGTPPPASTLPPAEDFSNDDIPF